MQLDTDTDLLARLPLFAGMDREELSMIAFSSERLLFQPGEQLAQDGQLGAAAYVILSGAAEIHEGAGDKRRIQVVGPGAMVGELAMLVEFTYASTITAIDETQVIELSRERVHAMMQQFPDIAEHFSARIHGRLARMAESLRRFERPTGAPTPSEKQGVL